MGGGGGSPPGAGREGPVATYQGEGVGDRVGSISTGVVDQSSTSWEKTCEVDQGGTRTPVRNSLQLQPSS